MPSKKLHATIHATIHPRCGVTRIDAHRGERQTSGGAEPPSWARAAHLIGMSNHTIAVPITAWAELRSPDREVLTPNEVATPLTLDPRTVDHAIDEAPSRPSTSVGAS